MKAASRRLGLKVIVVQRVGGSWGSPTAFGSSSGGAPPIVLGLANVPGSEHYTLLRPKVEGNIPVAWLNASQAEEQLLASQSALRGAGTSDGSGWLPPLTPSHAKSCKVGKWLPSKTSQSSRCSNVATSHEVKSVASSSSRPAHEVGSELEVWTCPWCSLEIRAGTRALLRSRRSNHLERNHKKRKFGLDGLRQSVVVEASELLPMDQRAWTCPFCAAGLGEMGRAALNRAKVHHYKTKHKRRKVTLSAFAKARWAQFKKDPSSQPQLRDGRAKSKLKAEKKRVRCRSKIDWKPNGHCLVAVDINWKLVPRQGKRARVGDSFFTCTNCRQASRGSKAPWLNACRGLVSPIPAAVKRWESFGAENQRALARAWGIQVEKAHLFFVSKNKSAWQRDLCADGDVERQPGPLSCIFSNVGGSCGLWKAFDEWIPTGSVDVLALQDSRLSASGESSLRKRALACGFRVYSQLGFPTVGRWGQEAPRGGVVLLVRGSLRQRPAMALKDCNAQFLSVWVAGCLIGTGYAPPGFGVEMNGLLLDAWTSGSVVQSQPWLVGGDWNEELDGSIASVFGMLGGNTLGTGRPTRWLGAREVDWVACNRPRSLVGPVALHVHFSDHIPIRVDFDVPVVSCKVGQLRKGGSLEAPPGVSNELWEETLADVWNSSSEVHSFLCSLPLGVDVQAQWDQFQELLVEVCVEALGRLSSDSSLDLDVQNNCSIASRRRFFKGKRAKHVTCSLAHRGLRHEVGAMAVRKKRHRLARLYELRRLLVKLDSGSLSCSQRAELCNLRHKLSVVYGDGLSWCQVNNHAQALAQELASLDKRVQNQRLRDWQATLAASDQSLGRWLKSKLCPVGVHLRSHDGVIAEDDASAAGYIVDYWQKFWQDATATMPCRDDRLGALLDCLPALPVVEWSVPTGHDMWVLARTKNGSGGPDAWTGRELRHFPVQVFDCFASIAVRWLEFGNVPHQMREARMCSLPKQGKIDDHRCISVEHMRPLTVLSAWWRLWISAWVVGPDLKAWIGRHVPSQFAVAHRVSTGEVAFDLMEHLAVHGCLATLDFTKAFDLLDPFLTCSLLCHLGWPRDLVRILETVWSGVERWVSFQSAVHPVTLKGPAMPQGDPMGPLVMTLWAWAGWVRVETLSRPDPSGLSRTYVDDRSFASARVWCLYDRIMQWASWSNDVGLQENNGKTAAVATSKRLRKELTQVLPRFAHTTVEILGCCTFSGRRGLVSKERGRLDAALSCLQLISCIRLPFERFMRVCRTFVVSKAAYGWIGRFPPLGESVRLWSAIGMASHRLARSSPWLRAAVFGGNLHLDCLVATHLVGVACKLRRQRELAWIITAGSPLGTLHRWLIDHGWRLVTSFVWSHDCSGLTLDLSSRRVVAGEAQHVVRHAWRAWCICRHIASGRRDADDADCFVSRSFSSIDWKATCQFAYSCAAARAVCCGASLSPASLQGRLLPRLTLACIWGQCSEVGTWDHIAWSCSHRPSVVPRPAMRCVARWGWAVRGQSPEVRRAIQAWLIEVQNALWSAYYGGTTED